MRRNLERLSGLLVSTLLCLFPAFLSSKVCSPTQITASPIDRAKLIRVTPKVNEILDDGAKIKKLERELAKARKMIEELKGQNTSPLNSPSSQDSDPVHNGSVDTIRSGSAETFRSRSASIDSDDNSHALSVTDYGFNEMAKSRNYVMPGQMTPTQSLNKHITPSKPGSIDGKSDSSTQSITFDEVTNSSQSMPLKSVINSSQSKPSNSSYDSDDDSQYEEPLPPDNFKLDAVEEFEAKKCVQKFMKGKDFGDSSTEGDGMFADSWDDDSKNSLPFLDVGVKKESANVTSRTDDESDSYDGPPASYKDVSFKFGSNLSRPDTLGVDTIPESESKYGTHDGRDGRTNEISWDTMGLDANRPEHVGQPLRALKSLAEQDLPIPKEVTIICASLGDEEPGLKEQNEDASKQVAFLKNKLEGADDIIESVFKDLERARLCIHDMVHRNVQLATKLNEKRRQDVKEEYEEGEINVEQYWLLKGSMYIGLFFFFTGGYELFMASVILIWLMLEANLS